MICAYRTRPPAVAMSGVTGNMEEAIRETSRVLAVRGRILPSTLEDLTLGARLVDGRAVRGESDIPKSGARITEVFIDPSGAQVNPEVVAAILEADLITIGPGSLYTSVLPNLLVRGLAEALRASLKSSGTIKIVWISSPSTPVTASYGNAVTVAFSSFAT